MRILAINTSGLDGKVCINCDGKIITTAVENPYSENIIKAVSTALEQADLSLQDIDCFGVVNGPGSFTGIRIGMAVIKGMLCGLEKPCVQINSFELVAYNIKDSDFVVVLDSGNADAYYAIFKDGTMQENGFATMQKIEQFATANGIKIYCSLAEKGKFEQFDKLIFVDTQNSLANLTLEKAQKNDVVGLEQLCPIYIKLSQAEIGLEQKMAQNLSFRAAQPKDVEALAIVDEQCFDGIEAYDKKSFEGELLEKSKQYFVALYQNLVIGYIGVQVLGDELNLLKIAVLPQYRNLGVGFKLMQLTFDFKAQNNLKNYFLEVRQSNERAQKLYKKFGFATKSQREKYYDDGETALVMFAK